MTNEEFKPGFLDDLPPMKLQPPSRVRVRVRIESITPGEPPLIQPPQLDEDDIRALDLIDLLP